MPTPTSNLVKTNDPTSASIVITLSPTNDDSELSSPPPTSPLSITHTSNTSPPSTPPRGRSRYPASLTRVPLHRRGTSSTYERLEDLLREAGYKDTRVFTPESERHTDPTVDKRATSVRGSVGAVVGFLTGLMSRNSSLGRESKFKQDSVSAPPRDTDQTWSRSPSPLSQVHQIKALQAPSSTSLCASAYSYNTSPDSLHKHPSFHAKAHDHTRPRVPKMLIETNQNTMQHHVARPRALAHHSHTHLHHYIRHRSSNFTVTEAPNARAYLRHMASAPNIQPLSKRPSSSNVSMRSSRPPDRSSRRTVLLSADDIVETDDDASPAPPLPLNWMESVAKALRSGVGSDGASMRPRSTLSEATNRAREVRPAPLLCAQVREQRSSTSQGKVSRTSVVCRSAPGSRAGSRVRKSGTEDEGGLKNRREGEEWRDGKQEEEARKGKGRGSDMVPSLTRTQVQNDEWGMRKYVNPADHDDVRQKTSLCDDEEEEEEEEEEDEEEEGELDLERILVPARRQASIRSLRKHLHLTSGTGSVGGVRAASPSNNGGLSAFSPRARQGEWPDESWDTSTGRRWGVGEEDEEEGGGYGNGGFSGSEMGTGTGGGVKRRGGLPGTWGPWGS